MWKNESKCFMEGVNRARKVPRRKLPDSGVWDWAEDLRLARQWPNWARILLRGRLSAQHVETRRRVRWSEPMARTVVCSFFLRIEKQRNILLPLGVGPVLLHYRQAPPVARRWPGFQSSLIGSLGSFYFAARGGYFKIALSDFADPDSVEIFLDLEALPSLALYVSHFGPSYAIMITLWSTRLRKKWRWSGIEIFRNIWMCVHELNVSVSLKSS
jgi:hypothetical protein